jgi:hypothetical protein
MAVAAPNVLDISPELGQIKQELLDARERTRRLCEGFSEDRWALAPAAGQWSVAECLIHLNITSERFIPIIDDAIRDGRGRGVLASAPPMRDFIGWLLCHILEPPYRIKMKTAPSFVPTRVEPMKEVLERFDYLQGELLVRLDRASGLALDRLRITSPFGPRIKYNLYSAFRLIPVHQRRHLWQAERTRSRVES